MSPRPTNNWVDGTLPKSISKQELINEFNNDAISRINSYNLEKSQQFDYIEIECKTFETIVDVYDIDFLSLDTEGNELKILQTIDFDKYNIDVITVENNDYDDKFFNFSFICLRFLNIRFHSASIFIDLIIEF